MNPNGLVTASEKQLRTGTRARNAPCQRLISTACHIAPQTYQPAVAFSLGLTIDDLYSQFMFDGTGKGNCRVGLAVCHRPTEYEQPGDWAGTNVRAAFRVRISVEMDWRSEAGYQH
jgi:hypothetical protein